jgi:electron transfer flavoprotein beta subunit
VKIVTCMKPVPDPTSRLVVNESKSWIKESDLTFVVNEADSHALEEALALKEEHGGEVVALSMGQESTLRVLRTGLATGADRAIFLCDDRFAGSDEFRTAQIIARAVEKDGGADLVLTGVQSDDLGTGTTGIMVAELLGWPHASVVIAVDASPGDAHIRVKRELEGGVNEELEVEMPCVLTLQYGINQPRYPSLKGIMAAKKKELRKWGLDDLELEDDAVGASGSMYEVASVFVPERAGDVEIISGSPVEAAVRLVEKLRNEAKAL